MNLSRRNRPLLAGLAGLLAAGIVCRPLCAQDAPATTNPPAPPKPAPATPAATGNAPGTLTLEVTALRFKPLSKEQVLLDFKVSGSASNIVDELRAIARSVDVLYRGTRELVPEEKSKAVFDATETRPVLVVGQSSGAAPTATAFGLKLELTCRPQSNGRFVLAWDGNLTWSPELMDRRLGLQNTMSFVGKAAGAAGQASHALSGDENTVKQAADIGLALAQLFAPDKAAPGTIYELPVVKTVGLAGSRCCRPGEVISLSTAAEAGTKEPQTILLLIHTGARD